MDLSNRTLGLLLVAAIVISIGGTIISLNRLDSISTTGFATNNQSGTVVLNVPNALSVRLNDASIDFGTCTLNSTRGFNLVDSNLAVGGENNAECNETSAFPDHIQVENDGNVNANITVRTDTNGSTLFGTSDSWIAYRTIAGSCAGAAQSSYVNFTAVGDGNDYTFCTNQTPASTLNLSIRARLNFTATAGGTMTLTFEAHNN